VAERRDAGEHAAEVGQGPAARAVDAVPAPAARGERVDRRRGGAGPAGAAQAVGPQRVDQDQAHVHGALLGVEAALHGLRGVHREVGHADEERAGLLAAQRDEQRVPGRGREVDARERLDRLLALGQRDGHDRQRLVVGRHDHASGARQPLGPGVGDVEQDLEPGPWRERRGLDRERHAAVERDAQRAVETRAPALAGGRRRDGRLARAAEQVLARRRGEERVLGLVHAAAGRLEHDVGHAEGAARVAGRRDGAPTARRSPSRRARPTAARGARSSGPPSRRAARARPARRPTAGARRACRPRPSRRRRSAAPAARPARGS
jgi:hypothetical protein